MLESDDNFVGLIEIDVDPGALSPTSDRIPARRLRSRLDETIPTPGVVERVEANLPQLSSELRAELRRFLERLSSAGK